jgi:hypothetical protein
MVARSVAKDNNQNISPQNNESQVDKNENFMTFEKTKFT